MVGLYNNYFLISIYFAFVNSYLTPHLVTIAFTLCLISKSFMYILTHI